MINYPGTNRHHFLFFYHLGAARVVPGHFTILFFSIILSVTVMPRIFVWIPLPHAQSWSRHCECCLVCLAVLRRHWRQQVQKRRLLFARNHALHPWTLSLCVYACTRGSCVDSIWLWVRKETFSKPVFGVSKTSISGFVAVGPHCIYTYIAQQLLYDQFSKAWANARKYTSHTCSGTFGNSHSWCWLR